MQDMTRDEAYGFLAAGTRTGKLATVRADGRSHVAPVWFVVDGDELVFMTWHDSVKARNLARTGRAAMVVDLEEPPYAFVVVEGPVEILESDPRLIELATTIGGRYMGQARAEEFGLRNGVPGEWVVRLRPDTIIARDDVSG